MGAKSARANFMNPASQERPIEARSWGSFEQKVRKKGHKLLAALDGFRSPILVGGCQRSGTTMVARFLAATPGVDNPWRTDDSELEAANVLSGAAALPQENRYCFQTTYLNDRYLEYFEHGHFRMVWVIRNPHSVVYSMVYNWKLAALNRLFDACGVNTIQPELRGKYQWLSACRFDRVYKACVSYNAKLAQMHELGEKLGKKRLWVIDYDDFVADPKRHGEGILKFLDLNNEEGLYDSIHSRSKNKSDSLARADKDRIDTICAAHYLEARTRLSQE